MAMTRSSFVLRSPVVLSAVVGALLAGGCASKSPTAAAGATPNGTIVQITQGSAGKVVDLHVGDTLRILLGPPLGGSILNWQVREYPRGVLSAPVRSDDGGRVEFVALAEGTGSVLLVGQPRCSGGPMPGVEGVQCPVGGEGSAESPGVVNAGGGMPSRQLTFDVAVSA